MVKIYSAKINKNLENTIYEHFLHCVSEETRIRIQKFHFREDSLRTLYGETIVRYMISKELGVKNNEIKLSKNAYGKPYIEDSSLHFNISHSADWVICALSPGKIGIDIEHMKSIDYKIAKRFFCRSEYEALKDRNDIERLDLFYRLWTLKECYIKWLGTGLSTPLNSFCFHLSEDTIQFIDKNHSFVPYFQQYTIDKDYRLSVCSETPLSNDKIKQISIENILLD